MSVAESFDLAVELQRIYDSEINVSISWLWDGGFTVRLGDQIGGYQAEETVDAVADIVPWLQHAIAHFYPQSSYAKSLGAAVISGAKELVFLPPTVDATAICPHCGAPNAMPGADQLLAFVCRRCGSGVTVGPPTVN